MISMTRDFILYAIRDPLRPREGWSALQALPPPFCETPSAPQDLMLPLVEQWGLQQSQ
jgi:hypothetical protein